MGNPVGSMSADFCNIPKSTGNAYIVGLWCADGYHRTSSIGLSNTDPDLIGRFNEFLLRIFPKERIRLRVYYPDTRKRRTTAYHLYVNCRPLLREFKRWKTSPSEFVTPETTWPYLAGRFDGDGSVGKDFHRDCRIVYSNLAEAEQDAEFLRKVDFYRNKVYFYRGARTFCLYISRLETESFLSAIYPYSVRLQRSAFIPRRDSVAGRLEFD